MKLAPKKNVPEKAYPTLAEYGVPALALLVAAASGSIAPCMGGDLPADEVVEAGKEGEKTAEDTKKLTLENARKEVKLNAQNLGVEDFKVRRKATQRLIAIGSVTEKPDPNVKRPKNAAPVKPYRELVIEEMTMLAKNKDPEVQERAKLVIKALTPKPVLTEPPRRLGGKMMVDPGR